MKAKWFIYVLLIVSLIFTGLETSAQDSSSKYGSLRIGFGINFLGPAPQMGTLMRRYSFNYSTDDLFSVDNITHPHYAGVGGSIQISYSYPIKCSRQVGLIFNKAGLREVFGAHQWAGFLFVRFSNISLIPFYMFDLAEELEMQFGPAFMFNSGKRTSQTMDRNPEEYKNFSPGIFTGLNMKLWDHRITLSRLSFQYLLTTSNRMGPFSSASPVSTATIPESKFGFSYLNVVYLIGFNF